MVDGREDVTSLVRRTGATIAVNGGFFNMNNYIPVGTLIGQGRVYTSDQHLRTGKGGAGGGALWGVLGGELFHGHHSHSPKR